VIPVYKSTQTRVEIAVMPRPEVRERYRSGTKVVGMILSECQRIRLRQKKRGLHEQSDDLPLITAPPGEQYIQRLREEHHQADPGNEHISDTPTPEEQLTPKIPRPIGTTR
jgi:hypothetical protein